MISVDRFCIMRRDRLSSTKIAPRVELESCFLRLVAFGESLIPRQKRLDNRGKNLAENPVDNLTVRHRSTLINNDATPPFRSARIPENSYFSQFESVKLRRFSVCRQLSSMLL